MTRRVFFDVSGLVQSYADKRYASGLQRILGVPEITADDRVEFIARAIGSDHYYRIDKQAIAALNDPASRPGAIAYREEPLPTARDTHSPAGWAEIRWTHLPYIVLG
jgi:hypothetical protein